MRTVRLGTRKTIGLRGLSRCPNEIPPIYSNFNNTDSASNNQTRLPGEYYHVSIIRIMKYLDNDFLVWKLPTISEFMRRGDMAIILTTP